MVTSILVAILALFTPVRPTIASITPTEPVIAVLGDSTQCGGMPDTEGFCPELSRLLSKAGLIHQILPLAVGGTRCDYWSANIGRIITDYHPDLVILGCGTNDGAQNRTANQVQADIQTIANQVYLSGARLLIGIPHYSSGIPTDRPNLTNQLHTAFQGIYAAFAAFGGGYFSPAMFDDSHMPPITKFQVGDGVHPTTRAANKPLTPMTLSGYDVMAHNRYRALQKFYLNMPDIGPDCMQFGHAPGEPVPPSFPCYGNPRR